jgi:hypothetical protein
MSGYTDLYIDQGADFSSAIDLENDDGTPINVTNYIFTSAFRTSYYTANTSGNLQITILNAAMGNVQISLDAANTANIYARRYVYDVKMIDSSNTTTRILQGLLTVTPRVTP